MKIYKIEIRHFRGIKTLTWQPPGKIACLIGSGDSTKTTILEAIELALTSRFDLTLSDADFHGLDTTQPIQITVTVGALPDKLQADTKYGLCLRGWHLEDGLQDEPSDGTDNVLSVRLTVDEHLEPTWEVWNNRMEKTQNISGADRAALGMVRIGGRSAWHLTWSRRSALSRLTEATGEAVAHLAQARRAAREVIDAADLPALHKVAKKVEARAKELGVAPTDHYRPGLSPLSISLRQGPMSLHDGEVPLSSAGMGTQRLAAITVQNLSVADGAILLFDEVELGLEPHRIRHLLRMLRDDSNVGQVLLTSHSPVAIAELRASELCVAQNRSGTIQVHHVGEDLQGVIRASAEALLSRGVLVCEGKTEVGLCRAWDKIWQAKGRLSLAHRGVYPLDGGGSSAPQRALGLRKLGYRVALFIDADLDLDENTRSALQGAEIDVIEWAGAKNTEQRVCQDLPWPTIQKLVDVGSEQRGASAIEQSLIAKLGEHAREKNLKGLNLLDWLAAGIGDVELRKAVAECSTIRGKEWFKRIDLGEKLGDIVAEALPEILKRDLEGSEIQVPSRTWSDCHYTPFDRFQETQHGLAAEDPVDVELPPPLRLPTRGPTNS